MQLAWWFSNKQRNRAEKAILGILAMHSDQERNFSASRVSFLLIQREHGSLSSPEQSNRKEWLADVTGQAVVAGQEEDS